MVKLATACPATRRACHAIFSFAVRSSRLPPKSRPGGRMTDRLALIFAALLLLLIGADFLFNGAHVMLFLVKKLATLINYLQFWR